LSEHDGGVVCVKCGNSYNWIDGYYDLYIDHDSEHQETAGYTPETEYLLYTRDRILSMQHISSVLPATLSKYWDNWNMQLDKLKETVSRAGTSERVRVEFMVDDYTRDEFKGQEKFTERKASILSELIAKIQPVGGTVLHVGCGGYSNRAIPMMYQRMGYHNWGVDVVRSYVIEFLKYGEAHLANATALPFANGTFDVINFTDILEHLFDPLRGLQEARAVLKGNGHIIIDTPNRGFPRAWNPISALRCFAEKIVPRLRKPRSIAAEWDGEVFFHTQFSRGEIERLLSQAGFKINYIAAKPLNLHRTEVKSVLKQILKGAKNCGPWFVLAQKSGSSTSMTV